MRCRIFRTIIISVCLAAFSAVCWPPFSLAADAQDNNPELMKLRAAAASGDASAELALGTSYHLGNGVAQDDAQAVQ